MPEHKDRRSELNERMRSVPFGPLLSRLVPGGGWSGLALAGLALGCVALLVVAALLLGGGDEPAGGTATKLAQTDMAEQATQTPSPTPSPTPTEELQATAGYTNADATSRQYEEAGDTFEYEVKQVDHLLLEAMRAADIPLQALQLGEVLLRKDEAGHYHYQRLQIDAGAKRDRLRAALRRLLAEKTEHSRLFVADAGGASPTDWLVQVRERPTHAIHLNGMPAIALPTTPPSADSPKVAVVIDDLGENMGFARKLATLPEPVTFAVWPSSTHGQQVMQLAAERGLDVLAHMPMEPRGYPEVDPGPRALLTHMDDDAIRSALRANLERLPGVIGINNHMGSRFTADAHRMGVVMSELSARGLFFLDSLTTGASKACEAAQAAGLPCYRRDVFIDNVAETQAILHQLRKAERIARSTGQAVAIGHPHRATAEALALWMQEKGADVAAVNVSDLTPR